MFLRLSLAAELSFAHLTKSTEVLWAAAIVGGMQNYYDIMGFYAHVWTHSINSGPSPNIYIAG